MNDNAVLTKPIEGYEGLYSVTSSGVVTSEDRYVNKPNWGKPNRQFVKGRVLKPVTNSNGYRVVSLSKDGKHTAARVHRIVAETFLPEPLEGQTHVRHKEGNKALNGKDDLEWGTAGDNAKDMIRHGTSTKGEKHHASKLKEKDILQIKEKVKSGKTQAEISREFKVTKQLINGIIKGKGWKHLTSS